MRVPLRLLAVVATLSNQLGCSTTEPIVNDEDVRTAVVVDPLEFLGELPCVDALGAPRSYRATLVEIDSLEERGRSSVESCDRSIAFEGVDVGGRYGARIEVFDEPASTASSPSWLTSCGLDGSGAAFVRDRERSVVRGCAVLTGPGTAQTGIAVDATRVARADGGCTDDGGEIDSLSVVVVEPTDTLLPAITLSCGQAAAVYGADIVPGQHYTFELVARDEGGEAVGGARCAAVARAGIVVAASCSALSSAAALELPIPDVLADAGLECGAEVDEASVALVAGATLTEPERVPCSGSVVLSPVEPGPYIASVRLLGPDGELAGATCTATAEPGLTHPMVCTLEP
jgi:hypothetical protein